MTDFDTFVILSIIAAYLIGMLVVAVVVSRGSRDVEGYTVGGRSLPGWAIGISVLGTFLSSISFLALPATTYAGNWNTFVFSLALPPAAWIAIRYFVPLYRQGERLSAYEFLEERFGFWARLYATFSYMVLQLIRIGTVQLLVAFAVAPLVDLPGLDSQQEIVSIIIVSGIAVIIYDTLGGIRAVIWTDVIQVVVLITGAIWCLSALLPDAWSQLKQVSFRPPDGRLSLGYVFWPADDSETWSGWILQNLAQPTVLVVFLYGLTENLRNYGSDQNYVQRMLAARSENAAGKSIWLAAWSYIPLSITFCLIGTCLFLFYQSAPERLPADLTADEVFPHFIRNELPIPVTGLVIAAILAAAMSTIDSSLNSTSTVLLVDVIRRFRRGRPRVPEILTLRLTTAALGFLGTGLSAVLYLAAGAGASREIMKVWWQYAGTAGGGMFGLFLLAWLMPRVPSWGAVAAVLASIPVLAWGTLLGDLSSDSPWKEWECPLHPYMVGVAGTAVLVAVGGMCRVLVAAGIVKRNSRTK